LFCLARILGSERKKFITRQPPETGGGTSKIGVATKSGQKEKSHHQGLNILEPQQ